MTWAALVINRLPVSVVSKNGGVACDKFNKRLKGSDKPFWKYFRHVENVHCRRECILTAGRSENFGEFYTNISDKNCSMEMFMESLFLKIYPAMLTISGQTDCVHLQPLNPIYAEY